MSICESFDSLWFEAKTVFGYHLEDILPIYTEFYGMFNVESDMYTVLWNKHEIVILYNINVGM